MGIHRCQEPLMEKMHLIRECKLVSCALILKDDLLQAWGLLELQRGNVLAAVILLDRCVQYEPTCRPVLQWRAVQVNFIQMLATFCPCDSSDLKSSLLASSCYLRHILCGQTLPYTIA